MFTAAQNALALLLLFAVPPFALAQPPSAVPPQVKPITKVFGLFGLAKDIKEAIEDATTKQNATTVTTFLGLAQTSAKLEVMKSQGEILVEGSDDSSFGDNSIKLLVPCTFRYHIDLKQLRDTDLKYDPVRKLLVVRLPEVRLDEPVPDREQTKTLEEYNPTFRSYKSFVALKERVLSEQLKPGAQAKGEEGLSTARQLGRATLQEFLQKVYGPVVPNLKVIVE